MTTHLGQFTSCCENGSSARPSGLQSITQHSSHRAARQNPESSEKTTSFPPAIPKLLFLPGISLCRLLCEKTSISQTPQSHDRYKTKRILMLWIHEPGSNKKHLSEMPLMSTQALHWFPQVQLCSRDSMQLAGRTSRTIRKQSDEAQWFCVPASFQQGANLKLKFLLHYHSHNRGFFIFILYCPVQVTLVMLFLRTLRASSLLHCEGC